MNHGFYFLLFQSGGASSFLVQLVPFVLIFGVFYFLVIVPQRNNQKKLEEMLNNLKNGDKVIALGGLHATVTSVNKKENTVQLQIAPSVKIEVMRSAVSALRNETNE